MAIPLAASVTLFDYLSNYHPDASDISPLCKPSPNTRNDSKYAADDILLPSPKESQNLPMRNSFIAFVSPQKGVEHKKLYSEMGVSHFAARSVILQANRALEVISTAVQGRSLMVDNEGRAVGADADRVGYLDPHGSSDWSGISSHHGNDSRPGGTHHRTVRMTPSIGRFFHSAAQVHYYMNMSGVRYGYILTDREFLVVMRQGRTFADIVVSEVVNWEGACGLNIALAIWYLHMLATDSLWEATTLERPVPEEEDFADTEMYEGDSDDDGDNSEDGNFSPDGSNR
ncbi:hypothetical protein BDD12DRAFT_897974 [Trichophaea hybrida]|nr:hypothetical protein BDD12DRAFT_897974 [Trichophaea hybrida]